MHTCSRRRMRDSNALQIVRFDCYSMGFFLCLSTRMSSHVSHRGRAVLFVEDARQRPKSTSMYAKTHARRNWPLRYAYQLTYYSGVVRHRHAICLIHLGSHPDQVWPPEQTSCDWRCATAYGDAVHIASLTPVIAAPLLVTPQDVLFRLP